MNDKNLRAGLWCACVLLGMLTVGCSPLPPLHSAIEKGEVEKALAMIAKGKGVHDRDREGSTPLHRAARKGQQEVAEALVAAGADVHVANAASWRPLTEASAAGHLGMCRFLVDRGARVRDCTNTEATALHLAAYGHHREVVRLLLDKGADVNGCCKGKQTPVFMACCGEAGVAQTETCRLLLARGADARAATTHPWTALHAAAESGNIDVAEALLRAGAEPAAPGPSAQTPLHRACDHDRQEMVAFLLRLGSEPKVLPDKRELSGKTYRLVAICREKAAQLPQAGENYRVAAEQFELQIVANDNTIKGLTKQETDAFLRNMGRAALAGLVSGLTRTSVYYTRENTAHLSIAKRQLRQQNDRCKAWGRECRDAQARLQGSPAPAAGGS